MDAAGDQRLLAGLRAQPKAPQAEIGRVLVAVGGPLLQRTDAWLRYLFVEAMPEEDVARCICVDETSTHLTYGRAPDGRRLDQAVPLQGGPNGPLIAALTPDGLGALLRVDGNVFATYLDQWWCSTICRGIRGWPG